MEVKTSFPLTVRSRRSRAEWAHGGGSGSWLPPSTWARNPAGCPPCQAGTCQALVILSSEAGNVQLSHHTWPIIRLCFSVCNLQDAWVGRVEKSKQHISWQGFSILVLSQNDPAVRSSTTSFRTWTVIDHTLALVERPVHHATDAIKHRCSWLFFWHGMPRKSQLVASEVMGRQRQHVAWTLFASPGRWKHLVNGLSRWHLRLTYFMGPEKLDASRKQRQSRCEWLEKLVASNNYLPKLQKNPWKISRAENETNVWTIRWRQHYHPKFGRKTCMTPAIWRRTCRVTGFLSIVKPLSFRAWLWWVLVGPHQLSRPSITKTVPASWNSMGWCFAQGTDFPQ